MGIQIGAKPDAGFDDPLGMLKDCHRRIEHFLQILVIVVDRAAGRTLTAEETGAIQSALNYFRTGGLRHNADEEESLFPRLRASVGDLREIGGLEDDHRTASSLHGEADRLYCAWIADGSLTPDQTSRLQSTTVELKTLYAEHIELEEGSVFPRAAEALSREDLAAMGLEFRRRRA